MNSQHTTRARVARGNTLASGSGDHTIKLWEAATGRELRPLTRHNGVVLSVSFSPDGKTLAASGQDGTVRLWDPHNKYNKLLDTYQLGPPGGAIRQITFTPDDLHLVTANGNGTIYGLAAEGIRERLIGRALNPHSNVSREVIGFLGRPVVRVRRESR